MAYKQIARELGVSVASAHLWTKDVLLTAQQIVALAQRPIDGKIRFAARLREEQRARAKGWEGEAEAQFVALKNDPLFMLGLGIYWGEGAKTSGPSVVGADIRILACWKAWLDKFAPHLSTYGGFRTHQGNSAAKARRHWEGLRLDRLKAYSPWPARTTRTRKNKLVHGVLTLCCRGRGCRELLHKILHWISLTGAMVKRN